MKKMIVLMPIIIMFAAFSAPAQEADAPEPRSLRELAAETNYPIKKLGSQFDREIDPLEYDRSLGDLGITVQKVNQAIRSYEEGENEFIWNIVATGMIIVFIALIVTGLVVALLEYFHRLSNRKGKWRTRAAPAPETEAPEPMSERRRRRLGIPERRAGADEQPDWHTIVAIATAIRLHESSIEEANRILATWKKASLSMWKTNRTMPNRRFYNRWGKI